MIPATRAKLRKAAFVLVAIAFVWFFALVALILAPLLLPFYWRINHGGYVHRLWEALDQVVNVLLTNGDPTHTLSEHAGTLILADDGYGPEAPWWAEFVEWWTDQFHKGHARKSAGGEP